MIEINILGESSKEYKEKLDITLLDNKKLKDIIDNQESHIESLKSEIELFREKHFEILEEKEESKGENKRLHAELGYLKKSSRDNCSNLLQMQNTFNEIKQSLFSCVCVAKIFICKFNVNLLEETTISKNFVENVPKLYKDIHSLENDKTFNNSIRILEEFIRLVCVELEVFYDIIRLIF
jgi:hypothetical protein